MSLRHVHKYAELNLMPDFSFFGCSYTVSCCLNTAGLCTETISVKCRPITRMEKFLSNKTHLSDKSEFTNITEGEKKMRATLTGFTACVDLYHDL